MFKFGRYYGLLFHPDGEGAGGAATVENTPTVTNAPATNHAATTGEMKPNANSGGIPLHMHEEKVSALHNDLSKERKTVTSLRTENESLAKVVAEYKLKEKKSSAFDDAISAIGEDFELPSDKLPGLKSTIEALADSETLGDVIATLVNLAKSPKGKQTVEPTPFGAGPASATSGAKKIEIGKLPPASQIF